MITQVISKKHECYKKVAHLRLAMARPRDWRDNLRCIHVDENGRGAATDGRRMHLTYDLPNEWRGKYFTVDGTKTNPVIVEIEPIGRFPKVDVAIPNPDTLKVVTTTSNDINEIVFKVSSVLNRCLDVSFIKDAVVNSPEFLKFSTTMSINAEPVVMTDSDDNVLAVLMPIRINKPE